MDKVKTHAEQRLRTHLMKRHKVKDRGLGEGRFPSVHLYRRAMGSTRFPPQRPGALRTPWHEEHRKAVCGKPACTV